MSLAGKGVRFTMLSACETSMVDELNAWTGIAPALTLAGIPAVVGMQYAVMDANAIAFTKAMYSSLAVGQTIDEAVSAGRQAIFLHSKEAAERDWGVPVLYLRAEEGTLFPPKEKSKLPSTPPRPLNLRALREAIVKAFSLEELAILCSDIEQALIENGNDLQVNLDLLEGNGKVAKVQGLITYLDRRGVLNYLTTAVEQSRPNLLQ